MPAGGGRSTVPGVADTVTTRAAGPPPFTATLGPPWRPGRRLPSWLGLVLPVVVLAAIQVGITTLAARNQPEARDLARSGRPVYVNARIGSTGFRKGSISM